MLSHLATLVVQVDLHEPQPKVEEGGLPDNPEMVELPDHLEEVEVVGPSYPQEEEEVEVGPPYPREEEEEEVVELGPSYPLEEEEVEVEVGPPYHREEEGVEFHEPQLVEGEEEEEEVGVELP